MSRDMNDWDFVQQGMHGSPWSPKSNGGPAISGHGNKDTAQFVDSNTVECGDRKKRHRRSSTAVRVLDFTTVPEESPELEAVLVKKQAIESGLQGEDAESDTSATRTAVEKPTDKPRANSTTPSMVSNLNSITTYTKDSESSSESGSTLTQASYARRNNTTRPHSRSKDLPPTLPNALSFLDPDSPEMTQKAIQNSMQGSAQSSSPVQGGSAQWSPTSSTSTSPTSHSTASSNSNGSHSDESSNGGDHDTDRSSSPELHPQSRMGAANRPTAMDGTRRRHRSYGTPEMPRGMAKLPHVPPSALTPRIPNQAQGFPKHLPRAEKLPLTGYEKLASRLTQGSDRPGPYIKPMYRRFEMLNHRLLLHLQDELCELEEQLHRLDTADTQNRRLQNCILPASRRAEVLSGGELQWHKTDVLGKIGFKLEQYNHVLSSFQGTESFSKPTLADVHEYRGYLAIHTPIAEIETQFLNATDDLVCLGPATVDVDDCDDYEEYDEDTAATPMARHDFDLPMSRSPEQSPHPLPSPSSSDETDHGSEQLVPIGLAMAIAIVVPILTFNLGPVMIVITAGLGILGAHVQARVLGMHGTRELCVCACFYALALAAIAGVYW